MDGINIFSAIFLCGEFGVFASNLIRMRYYTHFVLSHI